MKKKKYFEEVKYSECEEEEAAHDDQADYGATTSSASSSSSSSADDDENTAAAVTKRVRTPWEKKVDMVIILFTVLCSDNSRGVYFPIIWRKIVKLSGYNEYDLGYVVAAYSVASIISNPLMGYLSEITSSQLVLVVSNLIILTGCVAFASAGTLYQLFVAQFLMGFAPNACNTV